MNPRRLSHFASKLVAFDVLIDKIRRAVFVVGDDKKKGKERQGKEREGKVYKVTRRYISVICGAGAPGPIPTKFGMYVAPSNVINMSCFCNTISSGFRYRGQNHRFPIDFAGIVTTVQHYRTACETYFDLIILLVATFRNVAREE